MEYRTWGWGVSKQGATDWTLNDLGTYETLSGSSSTAKNGWGLRSYFGRINYAYKNRYLLEANLRADGSSRFGSNNRYGIFPSFSAGWKIHEERFMEGTEDWLSNLKLRALVGARPVTTRASATMPGRRFTPRRTSWWTGPARKDSTSPR